MSEVLFTLQIKKKVLQLQHFLHLLKKVLRSNYLKHPEGKKKLEFTEIFKVYWIEVRRLLEKILDCMKVES